MDVERRREREKHVRESAYLAPPAMVAACTARRSSGDWRGACAAGHVDLHVDLRDVASRYGADEAARIEADLLGFAPDLLRLFAPRTDRLALVPRAQIVLSRLATPFRMSSGWLRPATPVLVAALPDRPRGRQRIVLRVTGVGELRRSWYDLPDWCWHADAVAARRWAYGASATRLAWHTADGSPYPPGAPIPAEQPADRAAEVETISGLLGAKRWIEAYGAAGLTVDTTEPKSWYGGYPWRERELARLAVELPVLVAEARRLFHRYRRRSLHSASNLSRIESPRDGGLTVRRITRDDQGGGPYAFGVRAPVDAALLRWGSLRADELHPLVHEALFPDRSQTWSAPTQSARPVIRVRCGSDWHVVDLVGGRIGTLRHTEEEIRREFVLASLGGPLSGCAAAVRAWRTGVTPVPKQIRLIRRDFFALAFHGDTDTLLGILADGLDPGLRDGEGGTLLHWLHHLDHTRVLPFLVAAGLSVDERDRSGGTPSHRAAADGATEVMAALVAEGADPDAVDALGRTPDDLLAQFRKATGRVAVNR
ncbi:ankyrin repeat domain-containing protein [Plantactinospora soyae]|uniref:Ankyrin repeat domain-containing protein n=1 Tax=Plantactinospora soyae TaxID=1544732 RepID=A0A927MC44_9ACTN|nr:ankyrin repeat domain-containing protein [Plantactinospora soyae]MBE1491754.1 hypothetical protein [Plantactinospora soyae]